MSGDRELAAEVTRGTDARVAVTLDLDQFVQRYEKTDDNENPGFLAAVERGLRPANAGSHEQAAQLSERHSASSRNGKRRACR